MHNIKSILLKLGLDDKEIAVYESCLKTNNSPTDIARITGFKRTSVYFYLEKLISKGLIVYKVKGKKKVITALPLQESLKSLIKRERADLDEKETLISQLPSDKITELNELETKVYYYEGRNGLQTALDQILQKKTNFYWVGAIDTLFSVISQERFYQTFTIPRMKQKTSLFSLTDKSILKYKKFNKNLGTFRNFKFFKNSIQTPALLILFANTICLISVNGKNVKTVIIEDKNMFEMVMLLFQAYWEEALPANIEL